MYKVPTDGFTLLVCGVLCCLLWRGCVGFVIVLQLGESRAGTALRLTLAVSESLAVEPGAFPLCLTNRPEKKKNSKKKKSTTRFNSHPNLYHPSL
jgi:hypothetical protein